MALGSAGGIGGSSTSSSNLSALAPPFTVDRFNPKPNSNPLLKFTTAPFGHTWQYPSHSSENRADVFSKPELKVDGSTRTTSTLMSNDYCYSVSESVNPSITHWSAWDYPPHSSETRPDVFSKPELGVDSMRTTPTPLSKDYRYSVSESVNPSSTQWSGLNMGVKSPTNGIYVAEETANSSSTHWSGLDPGVKSATNAFYVAETSANPSSTQWSGLNSEVKSSTNAFYVAEESVNPSSTQWSRLKPGVKLSNNAFYVAEESVNPSSTQWSGLNPGVKLPNNAFYVAEESVNPSSTQWSGLNPAVKSSTDAFYAAEGKTYSPYVSPMVTKDTPLVSLNESVCGPLPASGLGNVSSQIDYTESLSGLEYMSQWGGVWNGLSEAKRGEQVESEMSFVSENVIGGAPLLYQNFMNQGPAVESGYVSRGNGAIPYGKSKEGMREESHTGPFSVKNTDDKSLFAQEPGSGIVYGKSADANDDMLFGQKLGFLPLKSPGTQFLGTSSPFSESQPSDMFQESSSKNFLNYQKKYGPDLFMQDSAPLMKPSRGVVIRAPAKGTNSPARNPVAHKPVGTANTSIEGFVNASKLDVGKELSSKRKYGDSIDTTVKGRGSTQVAGTNVLSGLSLSLDHVQAFEYPDNPSDSLDNHNPAEDSPCWKGAPSSQYSPLDVVEPLTPHQLLKKLEDCFDSDALGNEIASIVNESTRVASQNGLSDLNSPAKEYTLTDATEGGDVAYHAAENVLCSPSAQKKSVKHHQPTGSVTTIPKMDVSMLINTMHNLSGLLRFSCSTESCGLKEQDQEVLKLVMSNLDGCLSKKIAHSTPAPDPMSSEKDTSIEIKESRDLQVGKCEDQCQQRCQGTVNTYGQFDHQKMPSEKMNYDEFGKKAAYAPYLFLPRDNESISSDDDMVQAIKKVLDENFKLEEEMQLQSILFKNLWLEAEAKLCSISYRARFDRMKIQMDNYKLNKLAASSSNHSPDMKEASTPASQAEDGLMTEGTVSDHSTFNTTGHARDVEASVLARFNMLRHRDEKSSAGEEQQSDMVDTRKAEGQFGLIKGGVDLEGSVSNHSTFINNHGDDAEASVLARLNMLRRRDEKSNPEEQHQSNMVDARKAEAQLGSSIGGFDPEGTINNHTSCSTKSHADDVEASVLARFNILKLRDDKNTEDPEAVDTRKAEDQFGSSSPGVSGYESMKEFCLSVVNDPVIQPAGNGRFGNQRSSGWYDNSSSDWEHVLKDEFLWQKL